MLLKADLLSIEGVRSVHSLHMWSLTMDKAAVAVHLAIDTSGRSCVDACTVMASASRIIRHKYNVTFTTVQVGVVVCYQFLIYYSLLLRSSFFSNLVFFVCFFFKWTKQ
jgi:hypothetical protein